MPENILDGLFFLQSLQNNFYIWNNFCIFAARNDLCTRESCCFFGNPPSKCPTLIGGIEALQGWFDVTNKVSQCKDYVLTDYAIDRNRLIGYIFSFLSYVYLTYILRIFYVIDSIRTAGGSRTQRISKSTVRKCLNKQFHQTDCKVPKKLWITQNISADVCK